MSDSEQDLIEQGYKLITSRYTGLCTPCGKRYHAGTEIYWKKEAEVTLAVCPDCYDGERQVPLGQVTCPYCSRRFQLTANPI